ncbi:hypothetical protein Ancab_029453 [Ancistrocladus abbreviatus]
MFEMEDGLVFDKVGNDTSNSHLDMHRLAQVIARECDGLPLALITNGRAMASRKTSFEWQHAIQALSILQSFRGANDASEFEEAERMAFGSKNVSELPNSLHCPNNKYLLHLPASISNLVALEYLNLSKTMLRRLPVEAACLTKLRYLLMDFMACLEEIPMQVISSFLRLQVFRMNYSCIYRGREAASLEDLIEDLDQLKYINEIGVYLCSEGFVKKFMSSNKLQRCTSHLRIENCFFQPSELSMTSHLETLQIYRCSLDARKESQQLISEAAGEKPHQPTLEPKLTQPTQVFRVNYSRIYERKKAPSMEDLIKDLDR